MNGMLHILLAAAALAGTGYWSAVRARIDEIAIALEVYRQDHGAYPRTDERGTWFSKLRDGYLLWKEHGLWPDPAAPGLDAASRSVPIDPWGTPFRYIPAADGFELYSLGPNRIDDGNRGDDISRTNYRPPWRWRLSLRNLWPLALLAALLIGPFLMLVIFARRPRRDAG